MRNIHYEKMLRKFLMNIFADDCIVGFVRFNAQAKGKRRDIDDDRFYDSFSDHITIESEKVSISTKLIMIQYRNA